MKEETPDADNFQPSDEAIPLRPVPANESILGGHFARNLLLVAGVGVVSYALLGNNMQACRGSTRSSKLRWQQQQEEILRAEREAQLQDDHLR
jgi:hypothetical protein